MTGRLLLLSVAPLFMLYAAFAGELSLPGGNSAAQQSNSVQGTPVSCPDGRSFTSVFELDGSSFHVLGTLVSMEGRSFVVSGPTGDVPLVLSDTAAVSTGLVVGEPAEASGSVGEFGDYVADALVAVCVESAPTPGPTPAPAPVDGADDGNDGDAQVRASDSEKCNRGPGHAGDLRLDVSHRGVDLKRGTVIASSPDSLTVDTLGGPVTVMITSDTKIKGDLSLAGEVRIKGDVDQGGSILADKAWALCPDAAHHDADDEDVDADEQGEREDDDDEDDVDGEDHDQDEGKIDDEDNGEDD